MFSLTNTLARAVALFDLDAGLLQWVGEYADHDDAIRAFYGAIGTTGEDDQDLSIRAIDVTSAQAEDLADGRYPEDMGRGKVYSTADVLKILAVRPNDPGFGRARIEQKRVPPCLALLPPPWPALLRWPQRCTPARTFCPLTMTARKSCTPALWPSLPTARLSCTPFASRSAERPSPRLFWSTARGSSTS